ncbi:MAG: flotillin-like protein FloA [Planctomycetes bacterium]|nr:flotillin-like protein FloA [Planctomycetota bacterium]
MGKLLAIDGEALLLIGLAFAGIILFVFVLLAMKYLNLWIQAWSSGAHISFMTLIVMGFRKVNQRLIVTERIKGIQAGLELRRDRLEAHHLAGGNVRRVVDALIAADKAGIPLTFDHACAIDLAGRDVLEAVQTSVHPKVIDCPKAGGGRTTIDAVAKDGIQVKAKARVTVRTNLERLIGGATEDTIIARVGEGIVTTIGSSNTHKEVLENPDRISKKVLEKGLDAGTAFEILSIDIADVDIGENIGAKLQADQAEADKRVAQAKAEERRAMAVSAEQENKAEIQKNRALVVLAEAEVPRAMAQAFREGNLGINDFQRFKNVQADTAMRNKLADDNQSH